MNLHTNERSLDGHRHIEADSAERPLRSASVRVTVAGKLAGVYMGCDLCTDDRSVAKALRIKRCTASR